jgi:hypothetical protein
MGDLNIEDYPPVMFVSVDGKILYTANGIEINLTQLAVAYNELRDWLENDNR